MWNSRRAARLIYEKIDLSETIKTFLRNRNSSIARERRKRSTMSPFRDDFNSRTKKSRLQIHLPRIITPYWPWLTRCMTA